MVGCIALELAFDNSKGVVRVLDRKALVATTHGLLRPDTSTYLTSEKYDYLHQTGVKEWSTVPREPIHATDGD